MKEQKKYYSYDRYGDVVEVKKPSKDASEQEKDAFSALSEIRGVYSTYEDARRAGLLPKPQFIGTDHNGQGYWV